MSVVFPPLLFVESMMLLQLWLQKKVKTNEAITAMPLKLSPGWNHVQFNLDEFLHTWYSTRYKETVQIQVHATCRLRRIYFTDVARPESDLPPEFRLFVPEK